MLAKTGIPTKEQVESVFPNKERLQLGPVAIIECYQKIPCNPCAIACKRGAILPFDDINDLPKIDDSKCNGCGICITKCPGLAIMVVDISSPTGKARVMLPYEFTPLPYKEQTVTVTDRGGKPIGKGEVVNILKPANKTTVVTLSIEKSLIQEVRNFRIETDNAPIVCRCSDININTIKEYIEKGFTSIDELKRILRLGMGPCQGRTCIPIVMRELATALGKPVAEISPGTYRPVITSISLGDLAKLKESESRKL